MTNHYFFFTKYAFKVKYKYKIGNKEYIKSRYSFENISFPTQQAGINFLNQNLKVGSTINVLYYNFLPFFSTIKIERNYKLFGPIIRLVILFVFFGVINQFSNKIDYLEYLFSEDTYHLKKALLEIDSTHFNDALNHIDKSILKNKGQINYYILKATILDSLNEKNKAIITINQAIEIDSLYAPLYYYKGVMLMGLRQHKSAMFNLNRYLADSSDDANAIYNRGVCNYELNQLEAAKNDFNKAKSLGMDEVPVLD